MTNSFPESPIKEETSEIMSTIQTGLMHRLETKLGASKMPVPKLTEPLVRRFSDESQIYLSSLNEPIAKLSL
jgi:hypothetical protein